MFPTLQFASVAFNVSSLVILISLWIGLTRAESMAICSGFTPTRIFNLCLSAITGGLIVSRLVYALRYWPAFAANITSLISPNPLMFDLSGGILGAVLGVLYFIQRKKLPYLASLDAATPCLLILAVGLGLAHLASGYAYGSPTSLPWGLPLWGTYRQPTQALEILFAATIAFLLWPENSWIKVDFLSVAGVRFFSFFALSAFARLLIEPLRGDSSVFIGAIHFHQILAFAAMLFALAVIAWRLRAVRAPAAPAALSGKE